MFAGSSGTRTPLHSDGIFVVCLRFHKIGKDNVLGTIYGSKMVVLISPEEFQSLSATERLSLLCTSPDSLSTHPLSLRVKLHWCIVKAGDIVFIPQDWGHYVYNIEPSISVSSWRVKKNRDILTPPEKDINSLFLKFLNEDLLLNVFKHLSESDMLNTSLVSKYFHYLSQHEYLWKLRYENSKLLAIAKQLKHNVGERFL